MFWPLLYPGCWDQSSPMVFIRCVHGNRAIRLQVISPRLPYSPLFWSQLAHLKCNIPRSISHKAKQARLKSNIPRSVSHEPKQARFNRGNLRSGDFFFLAGEILFFSPAKKKKIAWSQVTIEDITWPRGDTKFLFECWNNTRREISGELQEQFRKGSSVLYGNPEMTTSSPGLFPKKKKALGTRLQKWQKNMNTALLSQGLLSMRAIYTKRSCDIVFMKMKTILPSKND